MQLNQSMLIPSCKLIPRSDKLIPRCKLIRCKLMPADSQMQADSRCKQIPRSQLIPRCKLITRSKLIPRCKLIARSKLIPEAS